MEDCAIYATMKARKGKEIEVEAFLASLQSLAEDEQGTKRWFALKAQDGMFAIFDTFGDGISRSSHLNGEIAKALQERAEELFDGGVDLVLVDVLAEAE